MDIKTKREKNIQKVLSQYKDKKIPILLSEKATNELQYITSYFNGLDWKALAIGKMNNKNKHILINDIIPINTMEMEYDTYIKCETDIIIPICKVEDNYEESCATIITNETNADIIIFSNIKNDLYAAMKTINQQIVIYKVSITNKKMDKAFEELAYNVKGKELIINSKNKKPTKIDIQHYEECVKKGWIKVIDNSSYNIDINNPKYQC